MQFPERGSVGTLYRIKGWKGGLYQIGPALAPARGRVLLPSAQPVMLQLSLYGLSNPECFKDVAPDGLAVLSTSNDGRGFEEMNDSLVPRFFKLTGLQGLNLEHCEVGDAGLAMVAQHFSKLRALNFGSSNVSANGTHVLSKLKTLTHLSASFTRVNDQTLVDIQGLTGLQSINLKRTQISAAGMKYLAKLKMLQDLQMSECKIGDKGVKAMPVLQSLTALLMAHCQISDDSLSSLAKSCPNLMILDIQGCKPTKAGLQALATLPLRHLNISGEPRTLQQLSVLTRLRMLKSLTVTCSPDSLQALKNELPGVKVVSRNDRGLNPNKLPADLFAPLH